MAEKGEAAMTKDEMQRFLDLAALDGLGEEEAAKRLFLILGISYPKEKEKTPEKAD